MWPAASNAPKIKEQLLLELSDLIEDRERGRGKPSNTLFNGQAVNPALNTSGEDISWMREDIKVLGLPEPIIQKLRGTNINTLGGLHEFTNPQGGGQFSRPYTDIQSGPKKPN